MFFPDQFALNYGQKFVRKGASWYFKKSKIITRKPQQMQHYKLLIIPENQLIQLLHFEWKC